VLKIDPAGRAAAARLKETGLVRYRRGTVTIVDRPALERATCECYRIVRAEYERLLARTGG
jgi:hypothetical protein